MNANNIRKVMGKENAGAISPSLPILGSIDRRRSVTHADDSVKEMIMRAPFIETVEKIGGSEEGSSERERKGSTTGSESFVQTEMESVQAVKWVNKIRSDPRMQG